MGEAIMALELAVSRKADCFGFRHEAMATELGLDLGGVERSYAQQAAMAFFERVDDVEKKLSLYRENSDVSRINRLKVGEEAIVSVECIDCLEASMAACEATGAAFHPFLGIESLKAKGEVPSFLKPLMTASEDVDGVHFIEIDRASRIVRKRRSEAILDFGGIGKGFALDLAMEELDDWEIPQALANFGGSTLLFRSQPECEPWEAALGTHQLEPFANGAISSSGLGFQGAHIVSANRASLSLRWARTFARCSLASFADALTTGAMLLSTEQLEELVRKDPRVAVAATGDEGDWGVELFCHWETG